MGNGSPGKLRRQGREAFVAGYDPEVECPAYLSKMHNSYQKENWMDGWNEAQAEYDADAEKLSADYDLHREIMSEIEGDGMYGSESTVSNLVKLLIERGVLT